MIFLFPRWDMLIPWRVSFSDFFFQSPILKGNARSEARRSKAIEIQYVRGYI